MNDKTKLVVAVVILVGIVLVTGRHLLVKSDDGQPHNGPEVSFVETTGATDYQIVGDKFREYQVMSGDTVYTVSQIFGLTVEELMFANSLSDSKIFAGQTLYIPNID